MRFSSMTVVITGVGREGQVGEAIAQAFAAERVAFFGILTQRKNCYDP